MLVGRITIIPGHPDPAGGHFCHALEQAYSRGASAAGHEVREFDVARLDFPVLRSKSDWESPDCPDPIRRAQAAIGFQDRFDAAHSEQFYAVFYREWSAGAPVLDCFQEAFRAMREIKAVRLGSGVVLWSATSLLEELRDKVINTDGDSSPRQLTDFGTRELKEIPDTWGNPIAYIERADYGLSNRPYRTRGADSQEETTSIPLAYKNKRTGQYFMAQSFQLISAGQDGLFGTEDDLTTFDRD